MAEEHARPVPELVDELFRRHYGQLVARLTRIHGTRHLGLVEDVASEALLAALRTWPLGGVPADPFAWLVQVARNRARDLLRKHRLEAPACEEDPRLEHASALDADSAQEIADDALRMIFTCCHPALAPEARVALTLKAWCGFESRWIARAFLVEESALQQRLVRAKRRLEELEVPFEVPAPSELPRRLDAVLDVVYLMFNEGHASHAGAGLVRADLVHEAVRLCELLVGMPEASLPRVHALLALLLFHGARLPARTDAHGLLATLAEQDRSRWDRAWIARGFAHFERSMSGSSISPFHVEAAIAALHAAAARYEDTDWVSILARYDELVALSPSPAASLARTVALAKVRGIPEALAELDRLARDPRLQRYHLVHAVRGQFLWHCGRAPEARTAFELALAAASSEVEAAFLRARAERCARGEPPDPF